MWLVKIKGYWPSHVTSFHSCRKNLYLHLSFSPNKANRTSAVVFYTLFWPLSTHSRLENESKHLKMRVCSCQVDGGVRGPCSQEIKGGEMSSAYYTVSSSLSKNLYWKNVQGVRSPAAGGAASGEREHLRLHGRHWSSAVQCLSRGPDYSFYLLGEGQYLQKHPSLRPRGKIWGQLGMLRVLMQVKWGPHLGPNEIGFNK